MSLVAATIWDVLTAAGGAAALSFIVALALGIGALTLFFFGSSVVVLEGFARGARRPLPILLLVVLWALVVGAVIADGEHARSVFSDMAPTLGHGQQWLAVSAAVALVSALVTGLCALLLRWLSAAAVARSSLVVLGVGYGLMAGGAGQLGYAAAPALAAGVCAGLVAGLRRWRGSGAGAGEAERALRLLALVLTVGVAAALLLPEPRLEVTAAGYALLYLFFLVVLLGLLPLAAAGFLGARGGAEWFIASRYLVAKRRQTFISVISLICVGAVAAGVWLIITVLSVMNGFESRWRDEVIGKRAHVTVRSRFQPTFSDYDKVLATVTAHPEVVGAAPFLDAEGMLRGEYGGIVGVHIRGVDPDRVGDVTNLRDEVVSGSIDDLAPGSAPNGEDPELAALPGIALGSSFAMRLGLSVGDPVLLVSPFGGPPTPFGPAPRLHRFRVAAIFRSSAFQAEEGFSYVTLSAAQEFLRVDDVVHGIEVRVIDFYRSRRVADALERELGGAFYAGDWKELFPAFFQALKTERVMMFVLLTMIMVVASFVIVATLIMMIMEKSSDIAILKAMGAEDGAIERIFAIEGTLIGLVGTVVGVLAGLVVTTQLPWVQTQVESVTGIDTLPASVYPLSTLPWEIDPGQVAAVAAIAMVLALGATLLPSRQGARLDPAEALRYE